MKSKERQERGKGRKEEKMMISTLIVSNFGCDFC